jgi:hypothetical protein
VRGKWLSFSPNLTATKSTAETTAIATTRERTNCRRRTAGKQDFANRQVHGHRQILQDQHRDNDSGLRVRQSSEITQHFGDNPGEM